jgi:ribosomal protein L16 Arg81 hydroxylase
MDLTLRLDTVENISEKEFFKKYFNPQKPVIIKGLVNKTPAAHKWTLDYIKEKLGKVEVDVFDDSVKRNSAYTYGDLKMPFAEFLDLIIKKQATNYRLFLFNGFKHSDELKKDFPCPPFFKGILDHIGFMFFGGKSATVRVHYDIDMSNVLHTQFTGRKRIILVSPEYTDFMYKTPFNTFSIADLEKPDYKLFPALRYVQGYDITLEPGDTLFMPSGYWHHMTYLEGGFGVAYRKMAHQPEILLNGILNTTLRLWFDKLMAFINAEAWMNWKRKACFAKADEAILVAKAFNEKLARSE